MVERYIPDIAKRGKEIIIPDPKPEVRKNAENAEDWVFVDEAKYLYRMANLFKNRLIDPILRTDRGRLPDPVISFSSARNYRVLASYSLVRNPQGLLDEITFNTQQYEYVEEKSDDIRWIYGRWAQLETLLHEQVHLWQQNYGDNPIRVGRPYHNKEFVKKCNSLGLYPKPGPGYHTKPADGLFESLMNELGIEKPQEPPTKKANWFWGLADKDGKKSKRGKSTLNKWICPNCDLKVRIGIKGNPELVHTPCNSVLVRADELTHTFYEDKHQGEKDGRIMEFLLERRQESTNYSINKSKNS
ncbi:hypothetical protein ACFLUA_02915 [Chloroflexota bacterium]